MPLNLRHLRLAAAIYASALSATFTSTALAAIDVFLKLDGIEGSSVDPAHEKWIDILSFSWGASNPTRRTTGGVQQGPLSVRDLTLGTKSIDKSSPLLMLSCATGQHIKKAVLHVRKAGGDQQEYLQFELEDVLISSYSTSVSSGEPLPTESISFNFAKIEVQYNVVDPATGEVTTVSSATVTSPVTD